jgi:MYXO-CTERM domain-containing protein
MTRRRKEHRPDEIVADLSFYRPQIMAIVPEPHPMVLAASGLGGLVLWRLLRRREHETT